MPEESARSSGAVPPLMFAFVDWRHRTYPAPCPRPAPLLLTQGICPQKAMTAQPGERGKLGLIWPAKNPAGLWLAMQQRQGST